MSTQLDAFEVPPNTLAPPDDDGSQGGDLVRREPAEDADSIDTARAAVARSLDRMRWSLSVLKHEVAVRTDWRTYVRARPWAFLGTAVLIGFLLGSRRNHPRVVQLQRRR